MPKAFYVKCRPQDVDIVDLARRHRRVFIGYSPMRRNVSWNSRNVKQCVVDISVPDTQWNPEEIDRPRNFFRHINANRWYAQSVEPDWIVAVPRPARGICYLGRIESRFELCDAPEWAAEYIEMRRKLDPTNAEESDHVCDVVQSWKVEELVSVPFPAIPRWISYLLLSRNTIGTLADKPDGGATAYDVLSGILNGSSQPELSMTNDVATIESRLMDWVSPSTFEHLVTGLLQCEYPHERWWHTGGAGDGGADALATNQDGRITAVLQCKWRYTSPLQGLSDELVHRMSGAAARLYIAVLFTDPRPMPQPANSTLLTRRAIAELLYKHRRSCPLALTLGVALD